MLKQKQTQTLVIDGKDHSVFTDEAVCRVINHLVRMKNMLQIYPPKLTILASVACNANTHTFSMSKLMCRKRSLWMGSLSRRAHCGEREQMKALLDDEIPFPVEWDSEKLLGRGAHRNKRNLF